MFAVLMMLLGLVVMASVIGVVIFVIWAAVTNFKYRNK